jgi:hypothetical protein
LSDREHVAEPVAAEARSHLYGEMPEMSVESVRMDVEEASAFLLWNELRQLTRSEL